MAFDYKKEFKELYQPKTQPSLIDVPDLNYLAVRGHGDPNHPSGEYKKSIELLYGIAFTIKMSKLGDYKVPNYSDFVVPPLEGFWWQDGKTEVDYRQKDQFNFISLIRLPDFVTQSVFDWAIQTASEKKHQDFSAVEFLPYSEGLCVQCLHIGSYDNEPTTIAAMRQFAHQNHYEFDLQNPRYHHEVYLSDPRRCQVDHLKTIIRYPIKPCV